MFNDPEWAPEEEWDTYAWFGFAVSEAQLIEAQLLVIATALSMSEETTNDCEAPRTAFDTDAWATLRDSRGKWTFGRLLDDIKRQQFFTADLIETLEDIRSKRNHLAHMFFVRGIEPLDAPELSAELATEELMKISSLFRHTSDRLLCITEEALGRVHACCG